MIRRVPNSRIGQLSLQRRKIGAPVAGRAAKRRIELAQLHVELRLAFLGQPDLALDIQQVALGTFGRTLAEALRLRQRVAVARLELRRSSGRPRRSGARCPATARTESCRSPPHARRGSCGCNSRNRSAMRCAISAHASDRHCGSGWRTRSTPASTSSVIGSTRSMIVSSMICCALSRVDMPWHARDTDRSPYDRFQVLRSSCTRRDTSSICWSA